MDSILKTELDKSVEIMVDVRYNPEYKTDEIEMAFLDREGSYTQLFILVDSIPHIGDLGKKYRWVKTKTSNI